MSQTRHRITVGRPAPRNPLAVAARHRHGGSHRTGGGALRQQAKRRLQRELGAPPAPSP